MTRRSLFIFFFVSVSATVAFALAIVQSGEEVGRLVEVLDVDPGEALADVGAGDGRFSLALAEHVGDAGRIYATEVDRNDLREIRERVEREGAGNVTVVEGTQTSTGLPVACCDGILLRRVYHHFQNPAAMRASLRESLKEGGLLLIVDFAPRRRWSRPSGIPESREGHGIDKPMLLSEMEDAGFVLVSEMDWTDGDYALLFRAVPVPD